MSESECTYTAQGQLVCKNDIKVSTRKADTKEHFIVREDPNEKVVGDWCAPISGAFLDVAKRNFCNINADTANCTFEFACRKSM